MKTAAPHFLKRFLNGSALFFCLQFMLQIIVDAAPFELIVRAAIRGTWDGTEHNSNSGVSADFSLFGNTDEIQIESDGAQSMSVRVSYSVGGRPYDHFVDRMQLFVRGQRLGLMDRNGTELISGEGSWVQAYNLRKKLETSEKFSSLVATNFTVACLRGELQAQALSIHEIYQNNVNPGMPPQIDRHPSSSKVVVGELVMLLSSASPEVAWTGWKKNGAFVELRGGAALLAQPADAGVYEFVATNQFGDAVSEKAVIEVLPTNSPPVITLNPISRGARSGNRVKFEAAAAGAKPLFWQWYHDGEPIAGATSNLFRVTTSGEQSFGSYHAVASNKFGVAATSQAFLAITDIRFWGTTDGVPINGDNIVMITGDLGYFTALRSNGRVETWGSFRADYNKPPAALANAIGISSSDLLSIGLDRSGRIYQWGSIKPFFPPPAPVDQLNVALAANPARGEGFAILRDGSVRRWGGSRKAIPVAATNVVAIAASYESYALRADGSVISLETGASVLPSNDAVAITCHGVLGVALRANGSLAGWNAWATILEAPQFRGNDFIDIVCSSDSFLALRREGTVVTDGGLQGQPSDLTNIAAISASKDGAFAFPGKGAPVFPDPAVARRAAPGQNAFFRMKAFGQLPISYQWQFNGRDIPNATNSWLAMLSVQSSNFGNYTVRASNAVSEKISDPMTLSASAFDISTLAKTNGAFHISAPTYAGASYRLEFTDDLQNPNWISLPDVLAGGESERFQQSTTNGVQRFFRLQAR